MRREYKILLAATLLLNFGDSLIGPFYAVFVQKIGGGILLIGSTTAFFGILAGSLNIAVGKLSDKLNKIAVTVVGYALFAAGSLGYLIISSPWQLFALESVFALGSACLGAPLSALFADFIHKEKGGLQWGLESGGTRIVIGVSVLLGTFIVNYLGFRTLFLIMFAIQITATLIQIKLLLPKKEPTPAEIAR